MKRFDDWPKRLTEFTQGAMERPFSWGTHDCCLAASGAVEAMTGVDIAAEYRGYKTKRGAYSKLKRIADGGVAEAATRALGEPLKGPLFARRGDLCLIETESGDALGWCVGAEIACAGPDGLTFVPLRSAKKAWRA